MPAVELEEYTEIPSMSYIPESYLNKEAKKTMLVFSELLKQLDFSDLNEIEKESLLSILFEHLDQFYLPGDKLSVTNVIKQNYYH